VIFVPAEPNQWVLRRHFDNLSVSLYPVIFNSPYGLSDDPMTLIDVHNRPLGYREPWLHKSTDVNLLLFACHRDGLIKGAMIL
jgi:hypothetical protein